MFSEHEANSQYLKFLSAYGPVKHKNQQKNNICLDTVLSSCTVLYVVYLLRSGWGRVEDSIICIYHRKNNSQKSTYWSALMKCRILHIMNSKLFCPLFVTVDQTLFPHFIVGWLCFHGFYLFDNAIEKIHYSVFSIKRDRKQTMNDL